MRISLNWIRDFVPFELANKKALENVVVGFVKKMGKHSNADSLHVAQVDIGGETVQIVCGGTNLKANVYVPVAKVGAVLPGDFCIKEAKIRGEESHGMICAKEELGLGENKPREIWILDGKNLKPGTPLAELLPQGSLSPDELANLLTAHTAEVESAFPLDRGFGKIVTGKLLEFELIEGSKKLHKGIFDIGWKKVQVIFGSVFELHLNEIVPIALVGARLPGGEIRNQEIMGVKSEGMVCSNEELGFKLNEEGMLRFPKNTPLGKPIGEVLQMNDWVIEIDNKSLTHRADLWGHYGIAREFAAIFRKKLKPLTPLLTYKKDSPKNKLKIDISCPELCKRFSGAVMTGIKIEESPDWLKARLLAAGMNPHNNIVDITNFVMLELGQPMHAYDRKVVGSDYLHVRLAKKGEELITLDETEQKLHPEDIIVCNKKGEALGVAGIKGGLKSGISNDTTEIILEAAHWDPIAVRKSSMRQQLRTDASQRFEKGLDPSMTEIAVQRAIHLIQQLCPSAKLVAPLTSTGTWKPKKVSIKLDVDRVVSKIGVPISTKEMSALLEALDFSVTGTGKALNIEIPLHRQGEVSLEEDLVEEVARLYGYNKIPSILPSLPIRLPMENEERMREHKARHILAKSLGFDEVIHYSFYSRDRFEKCNLDEDGHYKVLNYLSEDQTHMRMKMIPNILAGIALNGRERAKMKIFELGRTYKDVGHFMPLEQKVLLAAVAQNEEAFYEAKGALEAFLKEYGIVSYELKPSQEPAPYVHPKKSMDVWIDGEKAGTLFAVHPAVLKNFDIAQSVAAFALSFARLQKPVLRTFEALPKYPEVKMDISVLVQEKMEVAEIEKTIRRADKASLLTTLELFDVYRGKNIPENHKSLSFRLALRREDRTLTDDEAGALQQAIFLALQAVGGKIRGL